MLVVLVRTEAQNGNRNAEEREQMGLCSEGGAKAV
jgi:hypothetical protein